MKIQYVDLTDNGDGECDSRKIAAVFIHTSIKAQFSPFRLFKACLRIHNSLIEALSLKGMKWMFKRYLI